MERVRIAQFSDYHLGAGLGGGKLALPQSKVEKRRAEQRLCLTRFATHVRDARPTLVLLPGDLFDTGEPDIDDLNFAINAVNSMAPTPVFIAPGNHDGYAPASCYNPQSALYLSRGSAPKWGSHVRIFTSERFETVPVPGQPSLTVTGVAFHHHLPESRRALAELPRASANGCRILLFHGSLESYPRAGADKEVLPFTAAELDRAGYTYAAIGHYHRGGAIAGDHGAVLGAYAGAPFAVSLADEGVGTWLDAELPPGEPLKEAALHWHRCDDRAILRIELDVTGLTDTTAIGERLDAEFAARKATARDLVHVTLRGRLPRGVTFDPRLSLAERFFHAAVDDSALEPDYEADFAAELPERPGIAATSEEVFRWKMLKLYRDAATDDERARIKEALYYGLDAVTLGEIHLR